MKKRAGMWAGLLVAVLAVAHALTAWSAVRGKSATYDEPLHLSGAYSVRYLGDYRMDMEDPVLFQRWASLGLREGDLSMEKNNAALAGNLSQIADRNDYCARAVYGTQTAKSDESGGQGQVVLNRARAWMVAVSAMVCALVGWWAWLACGGGVAGLIAAGIAAGLYALDPNFLGHGALVKNDVPITLCFVLTTIGLGGVLRRVTAGWLAVLLMGTTLGLGVKFSGVVLVATVIGGLGLRVVMNRGWVVFGRELSRLWQRLVAGVAIAVVVVALGWVGIWAGYGFRYSASPDASVVENLDSQRATEKMQREVLAGHKEEEADGPTTATKPGKVGRAVSLGEWAMSSHLLPAAWIKGFVYTYLSALMRDGYLMGETSLLGFRTYFLWAALFKSPLGLMIGAVSAVVVWWRLAVAVAKVPGRYKRVRLGRREIGRRLAAAGGWTSVAAIVISGTYLTTAMAGALNLGLRHILPLYPPVMVFTAVMLGRACVARPLAGGLLAGLAVVVVGVESLAAYPNYIAFFNEPSRSERPEHLLSDSNLDWGQDLPELARWQRQHPEKELWLAYFGTARPGAFGITFRRLPGTISSGQLMEVPWVDGTGIRGVWAVSASFLNGSYDPIDGNGFYPRTLEGKTPITQLGGGSIWLFDMDEK